jgi:orotidine-5'-phosphate decarboxylase
MNTHAAGGSAGTTVEFATSHGIVPALDLDAVDAACQVVESTRGIEGVVGYKLGLTMVLRLGLGEAVRRIKEITDLPVLYDHQKAGPDVPDMAGKFCRICAEAGADGLILFPLAGPRAVDGFVGESLDNGLLPVVGGDLPLADYNASGGGYVIDDALDHIFARAADLGARHFIVPGNTADKVRHHAARLAGRMQTPSLVIPGIGALGGSIDECFAAAAGCNAYAVVGRAVYGADDPAAAARALAAEALAFA